MTEKIDLKQIEKKAYTSYHQDGLIDIIVGICILMIGISWLVELFWLGGIFPALLIPVYIAAKQKYTIPRIGYVKFGTKGKSQTILMISLIMGVVFLGFIFAILFTNESIRNWLFPILEIYHNLILAIICGIIALAMASFTGIKRFYIYSAISCITFIIGHLFHVNILISVIIIGICFMTVGIVTLVRFLQKYPLPLEAI